VNSVWRFTQPKRDKLPKPDWGERKAVTVCIAALFEWNYGPKAELERGSAALVLTDRMITAGDVQYEPQQSKLAYVTPAVLLMIAGDYSVHSQAIKKTVDNFEKKPDATPEDIAKFYGREIQAIKLKEAEDIYLAPLGLNSDSFLAQQKDMAPHFVSLLTDQMQSYKGEDVDALIVGSTKDKRVHIYGVDFRGMVSCYSDVGFAAIGSGAWHAKSRLMQAGYTSNMGFAMALGTIFVAKKIAELAPGVGENTDITMVFRDRIEKLRPDVASKVNGLFLEYVPKTRALGLEYIGYINEYIRKPTIQVADETPKGLPGGDAQTNVSASEPAAEATQRNEGGKS
jgi:20S proteasome alpha/beta subunit